MQASNTLWVVGVARNNTGQPRSSAKIVATLRDAAGTVLRTHEAYDYTRAWVPPGATMPFWLLVEVPPANWTQITWAVTPKVYNPGDALHAKLTQDLAVSTAPAAPPSSAYLGWTVQGQVHNSGTTTATAVRVVAALYDASGQLLAMAGGALAGAVPLAPRQSAPYTVPFFRQGLPPVDKVETFVMGLIQ